MNTQNSKKPILCCLLTLSVGFIALFLPEILRLMWGSGFASFIWITCFLYLTCRFRSKKQLAIFGIVFCAGWAIKFAGSLGKIWFNSLLFIVVGALIYGVFLLYSITISRWKHFWLTPVFPALWTVLYLLATLVRFPSVIRLDMLFTDMDILIQSEKLLGSVGFSFVILLILSLSMYALMNRRFKLLYIPAALIIAMFVFGTITLYHNRLYKQTVRAAYTTGPYVGDFLDYESLPFDTAIESMEKSAKSAGEQNADILLFNEEAFEIVDIKENEFLDHCINAARDNSIHILLGLDIKDTDESEGGRSINKIVWIDPSGENLGTYTKTKLIPFIESDYVTGDGIIPCHEILINGYPVKISYLICYDSNFPLYVNQIDDDTDILFLPSWDWSAVTLLHAKLCQAIAVENNVSIVKPTYDGISVVIDPNGRIIKSSHTDESGFESIIITEIPVKSSVIYYGGESIFSPFTASTVATEILSLIISIILFCANIGIRRKKTLRIKLYSAIIIVNIIGIIADAFSWILDGCANLLTILYISTAISCLDTLFLLAGFVCYLAVYIKERKQITMAPFYGFQLINALFVIVTAVFIFTGKLFTFENAYYRDGECYIIYLATNIFSMFCCAALVMCYRKILEKRGCITAFIYITFPILAAVINMLIPNFSFAYSASTLSCMVVYVIMQSDQRMNLEIREQVSSYYASHDELTGLLNRRAYMERLQSISESTGAVGVIFCDVNNLKYTNDNLGHMAGDRLLESFAKILCDNYPKDSVFRVSGDEFLVILSGISMDSFEKNTALLEAAISSDKKQLASIGTDYGDSSDVLNLVRNAETRMYSAKEEYHKLYPR